LLDHLPIESGAIYLFDRGYWDFARLYRLHHSLAFFIIRAGMLPTPVQSPVINNIIHEPMNLLHNPHAIASIEYYTKSPPEDSEPDDEPEKETASEDPEKNLPPSSDIEYIY